MYLDYSKLWKLLIDKGMSKTDLMELTGISSRVLAKLSKNQIVTTDTIARICEVLHCDVGDMMECASERDLSVYAAFKKLGVCVEETEYCKVIRFVIEDRKYVIYQSKQSASKATQIRCGEDGAVHWRQFYAVSHLSPAQTDLVLIKPPRNDEETVIVLIKGKPSVIEGLDENGFVSSRGTPKKATDVYVMSEAAFKIFEEKILPL